MGRVSGFAVVLAEDVPEVSANVHPTGMPQRMFMKVLTETYFSPFLDQWDQLCGAYNDFIGADK